MRGWGLKVKLLKFCMDNKVKYPSAFQIGYDFAYGSETYDFGMHSPREELNNVPKNIKDKRQWIRDWHYGCAIGVEY